RIEKSRYGAAGQDHPGRRSEARHAAAKAVGARDRSPRSDERGERDYVEAQHRGPGAKPDRQSGSEVRPGGGAKQVGVGEWVAEDSLVGRAGDRQHASDEDPEHNPWKAQRPEDVALSRVD